MKAALYARVSTDPPRLNTQYLELTTGTPFSFSPYGLVYNLGGM